MARKARPVGFGQHDADALGASSLIGLAGEEDEIAILAVRDIGNLCITS